jgi:hypothetical protein
MGPEIRALLRPSSGGHMLRTWPVDRRVGSPRNNGPELLEAMAYAAAAQCRPQILSPRNRSGATDDRRRAGVAATPQSVGTILRAHSDPAHARADRGGGGQGATHHGRGALIGQPTPRSIPAPHRLQHASAPAASRTPPAACSAYSAVAAGPGAPRPRLERPHRNSRNSRNRQRLLRFAQYFKG